MTSQELEALVDQVRGLDTLQRTHVIDVCRDVIAAERERAARIADKYSGSAAKAIRSGADPDAE